MKKTITLIIGLFLIGGLVFINSCKKDKIKGCTDRDSKNYNANAEEDDGSCVYEGSIVFWYNEATSDSLVNHGATGLTYYVDDQVVGSSAPSVYWTSAPTCGQNGSVTVQKDLGKVKSKTCTYKVEDEDGHVYWTGTVNFKANTCTAVQLTF